MDKETTKQQISSQFLSLGLYEFTKHIDTKYMFMFSTLVMLLIAAFSWLIPFGIAIGGIIITIVAGGLWFEDRRRDNYASVIVKLEDTLDALDPQSENFHLNVNAIEFYYSIQQDLKKYNTEAYSQSLLAMDRLIGLYDDFTKKVQNCKDLLSLAENERDQVINHLHTLIYGIDVDPVLKAKYHLALKTINVLCKRIINDMEHICQLNEPGTLDETIYQEPRGVPRAFDPDIRDKKNDNFFIY